jgi:hypothetical protein
MAEAALKSSGASFVRGGSFAPGPLQNPYPSLEKRGRGDFERNGAVIMSRTSWVRTLGNVTLEEACVEVQIHIPRRTRFLQQEFFYIRFDDFGIRHGPSRQLGRRVILDHPVERYIG